MILRMLLLRRIFWLGICAALPALGHAAPPVDLPRPVLPALAQAQVPPQAASFWVADLSAGQVRISHRAGQAMNPASAIKLLTTSAALELLGPQYTWRTTVLADGALQGPLLKGHLVLRGGGDPKLVIERLQSMLAQVQAAGIKAIEGDIVLDRSLWRVPVVHPGQFDGEPLKPYNAQPDALLVNFKSLVLTFTPEPERGRAAVRIEPALAGVQVDESVPLAKGVRCEDWRASLQAVLDQAQQVSFRGPYPASCGERSWPTAYAEPESFAARTIEAAWRALGGGLSGRVREATPSEIAELARSGTLGRSPAALRLDAPSLPLLDIVQDPPGSPEAARAVLLVGWRERQPHSEPPVIDNGSGLSRTQRITARALGELLQRMAASPVADELLASLPVAGVDATMRQRARAVAGQAWLKTGSLRGVSAIAGYAQASGGRRYVGVGVINHENASAGRAALDALVQWVVQSP